MRELERLKKARDEAILSANTALRDATRVTRLLTALNEPAPIELYLDRILSTISELFLADIVILLDPAGKGDFEPVASIGLPEDQDAKLFSDMEGEQTFDALCAGSILDLPALRKHPEVDAKLSALGVETSVWIPVAGSRESRGVMILARCEPSPFSREEIDLLSAMAYRIGLALEQIGQKTQLELLAHGIREIVRQPDEASIAEEAVKFFALIMSADAAALLAPTPDGDFTCEHASAELGAKELGHIRSATLFGAEGSPDANDIRCSVERDVTAAIADSLGFPCRALLAAPIPVAGRHGKWLLALRCKPIAFGEGSRRIATLYSRQIGTFLENAGLYDELRRELGDRMRAEAALRENEKTLRSRQNELQKMVEERDRLFSIIGHDLRGPVGSMCDLLRFIIGDPEGSTPKDRSYVLSEILQAGESIQLLLDNLLEWGKTQQSAIELRLQPLDLRASVEEVFALLIGQASTKDVALLDKVEPGLRLIADVDSLQTILRNLVSNAIKFTIPGGSVAVSAEVGAAQIRVLVADTGVGMDDAMLKAALDFATRRSTRGTRGEKGIGLGLILCRELVEKNGGSMSVESKPGIGTVVSLVFKECVD